MMTACPTHEAAAQELMVSVAMIAYNKEHEIADAIKGVVGQRCPFRVELVIVDDRSTDSTFEVASHWRDRYPDIIRLYRNETNKGLQANYLEAFSHCSGRYLAICDADDFWIDRSKLRRQIGYMESHPDCALTFHRVINIYQADGSKSLSNGGTLGPDLDVEALSRSNFITNLSVVYRRALVDTSRLPEWILEERSPDYAIHMFYAARGRIHYFSRPMGVYRIAPTGAWSMTERYRRLAMSLTVRKRLIDHFADRPEVVEGLRSAATQILLSMLEAAGTDSARIAEAREGLRVYGGFVSDSQLQNALARRNASGRKPLLRRMATALRVGLSRLIPTALLRPKL